MLEFQTAHYIKGIDPVADVFDTVQATDIVNMSGWEVCEFIVFIGVGATGTQTFTVEACDDVVPTNTSAIPFHYRQVLTGDTEGTLTAAAAAGFTCTAGSSKIIIVSVLAAALAASGYKYVRLKSTEVVNSPVLGAVLITLSNPRYAHEPQDSAIL